MRVNEYQELAMTTLNPELSKRDILMVLKLKDHWLD